MNKKMRMMKTQLKPSNTVFRFSMTINQALNHLMKNPLKSMKNPLKSLKNLLKSMKNQLLRSPKSCLVIIAIRVFPPNGT